MQYTNKIHQAEQINPIIKPLVTVCIIYILWKLYTMYKQAKEIGEGVAKNIQSNSIIGAIATATGLPQAGTPSNSGVPQAYGITAARAAVIEEVAGDIYNAFYKDSFFGIFEDEEKAIEAFNRLYTSTEAVACATIYSSIFKKNLHKDFVYFFHPNGPTIKKVKPILLQAIKAVK